MAVDDVMAKMAVAEFMTLIYVMDSCSCIDFLAPALMAVIAVMAVRGIMCFNNYIGCNGCNDCNRCFCCNGC